MTPAIPARLAEQPCGILRMWRPEPQSVSRARQFLAQYLDACGLPQLKDTASLVLSELVTNALTHAHPPFGHLIATRFDLVPSGVRIEVHDSSEKKPVHQATAPDAESGRGLALVDALTDGQWGVSNRDGPGKCVWAHIDAHGAKAEPGKVSRGRRRACPEAAYELVTTLIDVLTGAYLFRAQFAQLRYDVHIESDPRNLPEEERSALLRSLADKLTAAQRESADGSADIVLAVLK